MLEQEEQEWFKALYFFEWELYRELGAKYYDALYEFNRVAREEGQEETRKEFESKEDARQRCLFNRATMDKTKNPIYEVKRVQQAPKKVNAMEISPGVVPLRLGGKKPKDFFAMFKSFMGCGLMGFPMEPENVYKLLSSNPSFMRVCGFVGKDIHEEYYYEHIPGLRKLEQFDQIMREAGLWADQKWEEVKRNIVSGIIKVENELVGDTTHYYGYSNFETVKYKDEKGKVQKKSQSRMTKTCGCEDKTQCLCSWELTDDGAGTIVKSNMKMYWGHKGCILGFPCQGIPLDAVAASDSAGHDSRTLFPHVERLFEFLPEIAGRIKRVLYDSACDDKDLKKEFWDQWKIELKTSMNPRRRKDVETDLPRGIDRITPYGIPICTEGYEMEYQGMRWDDEKFIYQAPKDDDEIPVCFGCENREKCCPNTQSQGRTINVSWDVLPHIDPDDPPMAKRFKAIMRRRPSVERMIKRLKCDLGDDRLTKRGNASFQAYLDKTMIAFHILLRQ